MQVVEGEIVWTGCCDGPEKLVKWGKGEKRSTVMYERRPPRKTPSQPERCLRKREGRSKEEEPGNTKPLRLVHAEWPAVLSQQGVVPAAVRLAAAIYGAPFISTGKSPAKLWGRRPP